jgi:hypothetical protein
MDATSGRGLKAAVAALEALAEGQVPDQAAVLAGALALESLCAAGGATRETLDAAAGLKVLASGGTLELDDAGQARAGSLAAHLRALAEGNA